jgi:hypothetical protein
MIQLEKSLYDGGASPEDIAMVISMAAKHGSISPVTPGNFYFIFIIHLLSVWLKDLEPFQYQLIYIHI